MLQDYTTFTVYLGASTLPRHVVQPVIAKVSAVRARSTHTHRQQRYMATVLSSPSSSGACGAEGAFSDLMLYCSPMAFKSALSVFGELTRAISRIWRSTQRPQLLSHTLNNYSVHWKASDESPLDCVMNSEGDCVITTYDD